MNLGTWSDLDKPCTFAEVTKTEADKLVVALNEWNQTSAKSVNLKQTTITPRIAGGVVG